jgi:hypothetical protein
MTTTNRYEVVYGSKYDKSLSRKEIAVRVRADLKEAVKAGELPAAKYSVRIESGSVNVTVSGLPFEVLDEKRVLADHDQPNVFSGRNWISDQALALQNKIEALVGAYNFDGSDIQSDYFHVNFYSTVRCDYPETERDAILARNGRGASAQEDARLEALATAERAEVRADNLAADLSDETFTVCFY